MHAGNDITVPLWQPLEVRLVRHFCWQLCSLATAAEGSPMRDTRWARSSERRLARRCQQVPVRLATRPTAAEITGRGRVRSPFARRPLS